MAARILFSATQNSSGSELWVTDGIPGGGGTYALKDSGGNYVYAPHYLTYLANGEMVFSASDATHGQELWITDGTPAGTTLLTDINPSGSSFPGGTFQGGIVSLGNGKAVFSADDGTGYGTGLWVTDGVTTSHLTDTTNNVTEYNPQDIVALGDGRALFDAEDSGTATSCG